MAKEADFCRFIESVKLELTLILIIMKHFKKMWTVTIVIVLLSSLFFACEKESLEPQQVPVEVSGNQNAIIPYDFDWEDPNLNWMPYPAGQPAIPVPWVGQGSLSGVISDDVLADRKKSDGWKLVYSTFSPTIWNENPYFMLYNEYRGLLRIYQYVNELNTFANSTYLQDGLFQSNSSTKLLNFADRDIVDVASNIVSVDRVQPRPFNGSPLADNKWYFMQYELSYDPSIIPTTSSNPPRLHFYVNSINISEISLGGDFEGTINGTIGGSMTTSGQNFWNAATSGLEVLGTAGLSAIGVQAIANNTTDTNGGNKFGVKKDVWKAIKNGIDGALNSSTGSLPGAVVNVLSAIIGGSSSSAGQTANLTLSAELKVDGMQEERGSLPSQPVSFFIPGSVMKNSGGGYNFSGYAPLYNKSLGLFNLANKPTITIYRTSHYLHSGLYANVNTYTIKSGTLNFQWNPVVNGQEATIENLKTEIIVVLGNSYKSNYGPMPSGREETINGEYAVTWVGNSFSTSHVYNGIISAAPKNVYLRVSFVVKPKNGAPESAIVKTFAVVTEHI